MRKLLNVIFIFALISCHAKTYYISESGSIDGLGTKQKPWSFSYLYQDIDHAGDTIILLNGTYPGHHKTFIHGSKQTPVVIKAETWMGADLVGLDERAQGGSTSGVILDSQGGYVYWVDIEVYDKPKNGNRISGSGQDMLWSNGINIYGEDTKVINCVVHDVMIGISSWSPSVGSEIYGNLVYNIGWNNLKSSRANKGHGHAFYAQNKDGVKTYKYITNNTAWGTASEGVHIYTEGGNIEYFDISDNAVFNLIGYNQTASPGRAFILGGHKGASFLKFRKNIIFGNTTQIGYTLGPYFEDQDRFKGEAIQVAIDDNHIGHAFEVRYVKNFTTFSGNSIYKGNQMIFATRPTSKPVIIWNYPLNDNKFYKSGRIGHQSAQISGTKYYRSDEWRFSGNNQVLTDREDRVFIRKNKYDPRRVNIDIMNWSGKESVDVHLDDFVESGDKIEIRDSQNIEDILFSGEYNGEAQTLPMMLTKISRIKGNLPSEHARHTDKSFASFIIFNRSGSTEKPPPDPVDPIPGNCVTKEYFDQEIEKLRADHLIKYNMLSDQINDLKVLIEQILLKASTKKTFVEQ